jgi:ABC-type uncharacterized transport system ATPase component
MPLLSGGNSSESAFLRLSQSSKEGKKKKKNKQTNKQKQEDVKEGPKRQLSKSKSRMPLLSGGTVEILASPRF